MMPYSKRIVEDVFIHFCNTPLPKNKTDYDKLLGGILGSALAAVSTDMHERTIRIITKKYRYHEEIFTDLQGMYVYIAHVLSDIWRCKYLWVYKKPKSKTQNRLRKKFLGQKSIDSSSSKQNYVAQVMLQ